MQWMNVVRGLQDSFGKCCVESLTVFVLFSFYNVCVDCVFYLYQDVYTWPDANNGRSYF